MRVHDSPPVNNIVAQATRLGCIAREAKEVECGHIVVHHSIDSTVIHYGSLIIFPARRVNYTRRCTQGRDAPESLGASPRQTEWGRALPVISEPSLVAETTWVE